MKRTMLNASSLLVLAATLCGAAVSAQAADLLFRASASAFEDPVRSVLADGRRVLFVGNGRGLLLDTATRHYEVVALAGPLADLGNAGATLVVDGRVRGGWP